MNELNKIYLEDCITFMNKMDDESIDLIIADPPYNLRKDFGNKSDFWNDIDSWLEWSKKWINGCIRILKPTGSIFIYGIHHYLCYIQCYLYEKEFKYQRQIIWYYENGFSGYKTLSAFYEPILWFTKTNKFTYHEIREPYRSHERLKNKITKNGRVWTPNPNGRLAGDVWKFPTLAGKRFSYEKVKHPTQKPIVLSNRIVCHFSNEGDLVYIPFAGSGTECVSCLTYKRNYLATEINPEYIDIAKKRIDLIQEKLILSS
jgi:site-specific DNA-methyltransferase (adenine-specific)